MKPKILSWNVRGLNDPNKRLKVKNLLRDWKADVICLQETKLKPIDRHIIRSLWNCSYAGWTTLDSKGASGGILVMWDKRAVNLVEECIGEFSLACSFSNVDDDFVWGFAGVYGPNDDSSRKFLWDKIAGLCSWWDIPYCIGGDFNITRFPSERSGASSMGSAMADFSALLFDLDLVDLPLVWGNFTWSNGKLKALKNDLKIWNLETFGNINDQRDKLFAELQQFDERETVRALSTEDTTRRMIVTTELEKISLMEEISWRQTSRALWLKEGDRSTKFFHRVANSHRRNNAIEVIHDEGRVISGRDAINDHIVHFYDKLLTEQYSWRPKVDGLVFDTIEHTSAAWLERPFEEEEVFVVLKGMNKDKAPGPDGFPMAFFHAC
ncbi:uncharacterized protein LOC122289294 [Carya illinoinensis]|uniref:uncharacterized protein LOC122289294 n=1 Tax=Carya illinoinensis TaxID=32201 RepID=UPI001C718880|nr:uncharacterized protein LOC122289294 [Carya illinoinensis]